MRCEQLLILARRMRPWGAVALVAAFAVLIFGFELATQTPTRQSTTLPSAQSSASAPGPVQTKDPNGGARALHGSTAYASCDEPGRTPCPTPDVGWVPVASESPQGILAAAMSTDMYANEAGDPRNHIVGLDAPVLVVPYQAHTGVAYYDDRHYVIRAHDSAGQPSGTFDFLYDRAHHQLTFSSFGVASPKDPFYARPFPPWVSLAEAVSLVYTVRGVGVMPGVAPELIFFPPDQRLSNKTAPLMWSEGGYDPMRPMWHIRGADGKDYFVGTDSHVYTDAQLPIAPTKAGV